VSSGKRVVQSHWLFVPTTFSFVFPGLKDVIAILSLLLALVFTREGDRKATEELARGGRLVRGALRSSDYTAVPGMPRNSALGASS